MTVDEVLRTIPPSVLASAADCAAHLHELRWALTFETMQLGPVVAAEGATAIKLVALAQFVRAAFPSARRPYRPN